MKESVFELTWRLQEWINKELKNIGKDNVTCFIKEDTNVELNQLLKDDDIYEVLEFKTQDNIYITINSKEFKDIVKILESKRSLSSRYNRMFKFLLQRSPELFEEEIDIPQPFTLNVGVFQIMITFLILFILFYFASNY